MKHLKTFESINSKEINDLFSLWNSYRLFGPTLISYKVKLDWELEDEIDDHGYTVDYCAFAIDDDGNEWESNASVDKMSSEITEINDESCPAIEEKIDKIFYSYLEEKIECIKEIVPEAISPSGTVYRNATILKTELTKEQIKETIPQLSFDTNNSQYLYEFRFEMRYDDGKGPKYNSENSIFFWYIQIDEKTYEIGIKEGKIK